MRSRALIALAASSMLLAACGGDDDDTATVTEPGVSEQGATAEEVEGAEGASGPSGALTSTGVGEVEQGMSLAEIEEIFGPPKRTQKSSGCELDPNATSSTAATYKVGAGTVIFIFENPTGGLASYRNTSTELTTEKGDTVGDPFSSLQGNWGEELVPLDLGVKATPKAGIWEVKEGPTNSLTFDIRGGKIAGISGGEIQICE